MDFTQKIYYNDNPLVLTNNGSAYSKRQPEAKEYIYLNGATAENFRTAFQQLDKNEIKGVILEDLSTEKLVQILQTLYEPVEAGGGVVINERGEVLMIFRRGKWDLPKGKCDEGEDIVECSLREVAEETGLRQLKIGEKICDTYHVYSAYGQDLLKHTSWYKMQGDSKETLVPQEEENILEVRWMPEKELLSVMDETYEAIREVLRCSGFKW